MGTNWVWLLHFCLGHAQSDLEKKTVSQPVAAVLIDDSIYVRQMWESAAVSRGFTIDTFADGQTFFENIQRFSCEIPVFVDVAIQGERDGLELARQLVQLGFARIYLCTAYAGYELFDQRFAGVISKEMPKWLSESSEKLVGL